MKSACATIMDRDVQKRGRTGSWASVSVCHDSHSNRELVRDEVRWGDSHLNSCDCLLGEYVLGAEGATTYQITIKQRMNASQNACQKLFTDLYFDPVICLCSSSGSLRGLCILFFFNRVFYRLNKINRFFFFTLFLLSDKF